MDLGLSGKTALVTGTARGIGRSIAETLAREGARVVACDIVDGGAAAVAAGIRQEGGEAIGVVADVTSMDAVERMVAQTVEAFGSLDVIVNNAAIASRKMILDVPLEEWDRVLRTNLYGYFHVARVGAKQMIDQGRGGRIINISSLHGHVAKASMGSYCVAKAGVDMLTKQLAVELAPHNVTVNAVAPGTISTDVNIPLYKGTAPHEVRQRDALLKRMPAARIGEPSDIASMVTFLASSATSYVTGAVVYVDGGYTADGTVRVQG